MLWWCIYIKKRRTHASGQTWQLYTSLEVTKAEMTKNTESSGGVLEERKAAFGSNFPLKILSVLVAAHWSCTLGRFLLRCVRRFLLRCVQPLLCSCFTLLLQAHCRQGSRSCLAASVAQDFQVQELWCLVIKPFEAGWGMLYAASDHSYFYMPFPALPHLVFPLLED